MKPMCSRGLFAKSGTTAQSAWAAAWPPSPTSSIQLSRIGGLILMATPQTGSQRVLTFLSWFSKDFLALKPHGDFVAGLHDTLVNNGGVLDETRAQPRDIVIPTWAVLGASDHWVDKLSAGLNLPDARKRMVRGSHKAIVKPQSKQSDAYQFVRDRIQEVDIQRRFAADPVPSQPSLPLVAARRRLR